VLLTVDANQEGRDIHHLLPHPDVTLTDEHTGVMQRLSKILLEHERLETTAHNVSSLNTEHVIQLTLVFVQQSQTRAAAEQSLALENALRVFLIKGQKLSGGLTHLCQHHLNTPNLALVLQAKFSDNFHLIVQTFLLERTPRSFRGL